MKKIFQTALCISMVALAACGQNELRLPDDETREVVVQDNDQDFSLVNDFVDPSISPRSKKATAEVLTNYDHLDPNQIVPENLLTKAVLYFDANKAKIKNQNYLSVIDFSKKSTVPRFFIVNLKTGSVWAMHVAHGTGSDSNSDGFAEKFSNVSGSNASSLGFYQASEIYVGKNGNSMRLDGLSATNSRARARAVVIHGANYVRDANVIQGRSWGCPAVSHTNREEVLKRLKNGSIIYAGLSAKE